MSLKVLVVEDDLPTLEMMREVLASFELEVQCESDSNNAALIVNQRQFDGIFLDLLMPGLNGFQLARQIRDSLYNKTTPIVIVTGNEDRKTMEEGFAAGGSFFLSKPIDRRRLTFLLNSTRGAMLESRRRVQRAKMRTDVRCTLERQSIQGMSCDIGETGMLLECDGALKAGESAGVSFTLPGQRVVMNLSGLVVRVDEQKRAGLSFSNLGQVDRQRIRIYVGQ
jgi:CheY-like chemotaxis protein